MNANSKLFSLIIGLMMAGLVSVVAVGDKVSMTLAQTQALDAIEFITPDNAPPSPARVGGGGLAGCSCLGCGARVVGLLPSTDLGLTVSAHPTFFATALSVDRQHLQRRQPELSGMLTELVILNENGEEYVASVQFSSTEVSGTMALTLPETLPGLELDKPYHWYIALFCNQEDLIDNVYTGGWIERVEPNAVIQNAIQKASAEEKLAIYAREGIWHETLTVLTQLLEAQPDNAAVMQVWQRVLTSARLQEIAAEPLVKRSSIQVIPEKQ